MGSLHAVTRAFPALNRIFRAGKYKQQFVPMFSPAQLVHMAEEIRRTAGKGCIVEAGCAYGLTTVFLAKFAEQIGISYPYYAIDTFSGFVPAHADYEVLRRGKKASIRGAFATNDKTWFEARLANAGITNVKVIKSDVTKVDIDALGPIAFCLLDVDLYVPILDVLPKLHQALAPGGIILLDDCKPYTLYDGALQAYEEYCAASEVTPEIVWDKLGVVRAKDSS